MKMRSENSCRLYIEDSIVRRQQRVAKRCDKGKKETQRKLIEVRGIRSCCWQTGRNYSQAVWNPITWKISLKTVDKYLPEGILLLYLKVRKLDYHLNYFLALPSAYHSILLLCSGVFKITYDSMIIINRKVSVTNVKTMALTPLADCSLRVTKYSQALIYLTQPNLMSSYAKHWARQLMRHEYGLQWLHVGKKGIHNSSNATYNVLKVHKRRELLLLETREDVQEKGADCKAS